MLSLTTEGSVESAVPATVLYLSLSTFYLCISGTFCSLFFSDNIAASQIREVKWIDELLMVRLAYIRNARDDFHVTWCFPRHVMFSTSCDVFHLTDVFHVTWCFLYHVMFSASRGIFHVTWYHEYTIPRLISSTYFINKCCFQFHKMLTFRYVCNI